MTVSEPAWDELFRRAESARTRAYAPFSRFLVGAALLGDDGAIYPGVNVENRSFGLTICAERVALGNALSAGCRGFRAIAIVADSEEPIVPCGACRQVLAEFCEELEIRSRTLRTGDRSGQFSLTELFPRPRQGILDRAEDGKRST